MNKEIHPISKVVTFKCASCGSEFNILSTSKQDPVPIDVCSHCHPLYVSGLSDQKAKGRAEKLANRFNTQLKAPGAPTQPNPKKLERVAEPVEEQPQVEVQPEPVNEEPVREEVVEQPIVEEQPQVEVQPEPVNEEPVREEVVEQQVVEEQPQVEVQPEPVNEEPIKEEVAEQLVEESPQQEQYDSQQYQQPEPQQQYYQEPEQVPYHSPVVPEIQRPRYNQEEFEELDPADPDYIAKMVQQQFRANVNTIAKENKMQVHSSETTVVNPLDSKISIARPEASTQNIINTRPTSYTPPQNSYRKINYDSLSQQIAYESQHGINRPSQQHSYEQNNNQELDPSDPDYIAKMVQQQFRANVNTIAKENKMEAHSSENHVDNGITIKIPWQNDDDSNKNK